MRLSAGSRLGPYEIISPIGAGGMAEVYRARDTCLDRDIAIKVPAEAFSERFRAEAQAVASLNHPNVCQLYDVGPNYSDPSARSTVTVRSSSRPDTRTRQGLQQTSQSWTKLPRTSGSR